MDAILAIGLLVGLSAVGAGWAHRWGPPRSRWRLTEVFASFAFFVGAAGLSGMAISVVLEGVPVPESGNLLPGILGTAHASVLAAALILRRADAGVLGLGAAAGWAWGAAGAGVPLFLAVSASWAWFLEAAGWGFQPQQMLTILSDADTLEMVVILGYGSLGAPLVEELVFRGFLMPPLVRHAGLGGAVVASGAVFGLVHISDPAAVVPLVVLGIGLGWLRVRSGSIWPGVVVHVLNNAIALAVSLNVASPGT